MGVTLVSFWFGNDLSVESVRLNDLYYHLNFSTVIYTSGEILAIDLPTSSGGVLTPQGTRVLDLERMPSCIEFCGRSIC
jgi:hypothetical protein